VTRGGLVEYLIVAGGGSGADVGGGGAGGVRTGQILLSAQAYTITVGAGAAGAGDNTGPGDNGSLSSAFELIAAGGGGAGGGFGQSRGNSGGSGGAGSTSNLAADISGTLSKLTGGNLATGLQSLAGQISAGAGIVNNVLSLFKGASVPPGGELFIKQGSAIQLAPGSKNDWRVRVTCDWSLFNSPLFKPLENTGGVVWPYLPNISVTTRANYTSPDTVHSIYPFQAYKNSMVEDITISGEFTCETELEAAYWIGATTFFKTATKMFFGQGDQAGSPPIICNLTGYGSSIFDKVPVIIKSFTVDLKDDVN
jgi:hypothetical protein